MMVHSLPMKSRKRLAHDAMYTFATYADLVQDIKQSTRQKMAALIKKKKFKGKVYHSHQ